ncbi:DUF2628 domain-containing protein [Paenibacillus sp. Marseille-Q4541]|uniref:DUF2628 domain-containing protein n=1 Tax=Paenibacillus sp. Marseille-Q4541 TaxID=2831522 RepID=UPI001BA83867
MRVVLANEAGVTKDVKVGFSWTTFFFTFFPALFRGDLKWAFIMFLLTVAFGSFTFGIGGWVCGLVFAFVYNKIYIKELLEKGYRPVNEYDRAALENRNIISRMA